ncbi:MAG: hypothetical protein KatS3mg085_258 [Candidatus Dojkabacteria bacterium]|nr:MAG: hypothetical protein KatS3mg085_258 [Candidatus Dojkabacteria bacterium]
MFEAETISDTISASPIVTYSILGTDKFGRMDKVSDKKYSAKVVVSDLDPGVYTIQANITEPGENLKVVRSKAVEFYITYPLYVTWTQDWEGFDVSENNLNAMANTADSYGMPMVHLFNPRIYVQNQYSYKPISQDRAQYSDFMGKRETKK